MFQPEILTINSNISGNVVNVGIAKQGGDEKFCWLWLLNFNGFLLCGGFLSPLE